MCLAHCLAVNFANDGVEAPTTAVLSSYIQTTQRGHGDLADRTNMTSDRIASRTLRTYLARFLKACLRSSKLTKFISEVIRIGGSGWR